jgi:hypothetical protein
MSKQHAKLSASYSSTWLNCPASINAGADIKDTSGKAAQEGSFAHAIAELCLTHNFDASYYLNATIPSHVYDEFDYFFSYDEDMAKYIQIYLDYVRDFNLPFKIEVKADYSQWVLDGFGTSDIVMYDSKIKTLHVIDLKFGAGVLVEAYKNAQLMLYALGSLKGYDVSKIVLHVVQPRMNNIDHYALSIHELLKFGEFAASRAKDALSDNPTYRPGEKACKWCKCRFTCKPLASYHAKALKVSSLFTNLDTPSVSSLTDDEIVNILNNKPFIETFLSNIKEKVLNDLQDGFTVLGYELGRTNKRDKWLCNAEEILKSHLPDDKVYKKSLISIKEAKKFIDSDLITKLTYTPQGDLKLKRIKQ